MQIFYFGGEFEEFAHGLGRGGGGGEGGALTVFSRLASVAWRSSQSGRARKRAREQSDGGGRRGERKNASRQTPLKREKSFRVIM